MSFPTSVFSNVFRQFVKILKNDPILKREVVSWNVWDGSSGDLRDPTLADCPYLRLTPAALTRMSFQTTWSSTRTLHTPMEITVDLMTKGTNVDVSNDFWHAIIKSIFPDDPTRLAAVAARWNELSVPGKLDIMTPRFLHPALEPTAENNIIAIKANGSVIIDIYEKV